MLTVFWDLMSHVRQHCESAEESSRADQLTAYSKKRLRPTCWKARERRRIYDDADETAITLAYISMQLAVRCNRAGELSLVG